MMRNDNGISGWGCFWILVGVFSMLCLGLLAMMG